MNTIFKHTLFPGQTFLLLPKDAQVLTVQAQYDEPQLWVRCNPAAPTEARIFEIVTTGQTTIDDPRDIYVGTFQSHGGAFVGHVFEVFP